jgi:hypothetical protein
MPTNGRTPSADPASSEAALRTALAVAHAGYHRALEEAHCADDPDERRAAMAEARRLAGRAAHIESELEGR